MKKLFYYSTATFALPVSLLLLILLQTGCTSYEIASLWREKEINIDGSSSDWLGTLTYIEKHGISVGLQNDTESLYVCLVSGEYSPYMSVMRRGFTLWFDAQGKKNKTLGIKLAQPRPQPPPEGNNPDFDREAFLSEQSEKNRIPQILILTGEDDPGTGLDQENTFGIKARRQIASGLLVYEFKIPLNKNEDQPYAVASYPGDIIGIGFESGKLDRTNMRSPEGPSGRRGGGSLPGGMGGRTGMGGRGGMAGGGRGRPGSSSGKDLKVWIKTELAVQLSPSFNPSAGVENLPAAVAFLFNMEPTI